MTTVATPRRGRGLNRIPDHKRHLLGGPHVVGSAVLYTLPVDRRDHLHPTRVDQGRSSSCTGGGTSQLVFCGLSCNGTPLPWLPSPRGIYGNVRSIEQTGTAPLTDTGADPTDLKQSCGVDGVRPMSPIVSPDGRAYDLWTANDLFGVPNAPAANDGLRPTASEDEVSAKDLVTGLSVLNASASDFEDQVAGSLAEGCPVGIGLDATPAFEAHGDKHHDDAMPALDDASGATDSDGHWAGCYAARQGPAGHEFFILSSWGAEWGVNGGVWVTASWLRQRAQIALKFRCTLGVAS